MWDFFLCQYCFIYNYLQLFTSTYLHKSLHHLPKKNSRFFKGNCGFEKNVPNNLPNI